MEADETVFYLGGVGPSQAESKGVCNESYGKEACDSAFGAATHSCKLLRSLYSASISG